MAEAEEILFDKEGETGVITLNRPAARNALTFGMYARIAEICSAPPADVRVLVITGAGDRAFAAGTDIAQFREFESGQDAIDYERRIDQVLTAVEKCPLPLIAAIAGACTGGGAAIASACDLRLATADLKFGFPIARTLGNCLSARSLARLSALVGASRVREMIFTSRLMGAEEARAAGLITEIAEDRRHLDDRVRELADVIAEQAPLTLRATKELQRRLAEHAVDDEDMIRLCYTSADFKEGIEAFFAKRRPRWRGE